MHDWQLSSVLRVARGLSLQARLLCAHLQVSEEVLRRSPSNSAAVWRQPEGTRCERDCFTGAGGGVRGTAGCTWLGGVMGELHNAARSHQTHLEHLSQDFCACMLQRQS